jgi:hypothetical protein
MARAATSTTWLLATFLVACAACGNQSMLGAPLDKALAEVDGSIARGDVEVACGRLQQVVPQLAAWVKDARGERAAVGNQVLGQLGELSGSCAAPPAGDPTRLATAWPPLYQELRRVSTYKTSWLTVFTYVSMLAVGIGTYLLLRRKRSA